MPGSAPFSMNVVDCALKLESGYGTGGSLSNTTDGFELWLESKIPALGELGHLDLGEMGPQMGGLGMAPRVAAAGRTFKATLPFFFRGPGAAYSSSVASSLRRILQICGFDVAVDTTSSSEEEAFTLTAEGSTPASGYGKFMSRGEEITADGLFGSLRIEGRNAKPWLHTVNLVGRQNADVVARSFGAVTYPLGSVTIPVGAPAALVLGDFTAAVVRSFSVDLQRKIDNPRPNLNAAGYLAGYQASTRNPRIRVVIEQTSLVSSSYHTSSGLNAYKLLDLGTAIAFSAQQGTAQYNREKLAAARCQVMSVGRTADADVPCWEIELMPVPSAPGTSDDLTITGD